MPKVSGLLHPRHILPSCGAKVPASGPAAMISLFSGPRGLQFGTTSLFMIRAIRPLPPMIWYASGRDSLVTFAEDISARTIFKLISTFQRLV
jgi:hypothetical protein